jgi:hypothetical protein
MKYILLLCLLFACKPNQNSTLRINDISYNKNKRELEKLVPKSKEFKNRCVEIILTKNQDVQSLVLAYYQLHINELWRDPLNTEDGRNVFVEVEGQGDDDDFQIGRKIGKAHEEYSEEFKFILLNNYSKYYKEICLGAVYQLPSEKGADIYMSFIEKYNNEQTELASFHLIHNKYLSLYKFDVLNYLERVKLKYPNAYKKIKKITESVKQ